MDFLLLKFMIYCLQDYSFMLDSSHAEMDGVAATWKYYGAAWGWSLVYTYKKKTLVYLTPAQAQFYVVLSFNEQCKLYELPEHIMKCSETAKSNGAGRTFDVIETCLYALIKTTFRKKGCFYLPPPHRRG